MISNARKTLVVGATAAVSGMIGVAAAHADRPLFDRKDEVARKLSYVGLGTVTAAAFGGLTGLATARGNLVARDLPRAVQHQRAAFGAVLGAAMIGTGVVAAGVADGSLFG